MTLPTPDTEAGNVLTNHGSELCTVTVSSDIQAHKALGLIVDPILVIHAGFAPLQAFGLKQ